MLVEDFVTLTCPSCSGQLQITSDIDRFACGYCGTEHLVKRSGGIVAIAPVIEGIKKVQRGVDKTASELAIVRLDKEISQIERQIDEINKSWEDVDVMGTAGSIGFLSGLGVAVFAGEFDPGLIAGFIAFVLTIVVYFFLEQNDKQQIEPLKYQIEQKKRELTKHQNIVSS